MTLRRIGGAAGIAYAVLVAIENLNVLDTPSLGAPAAEIAHHYTVEREPLMVMAVAGGLALSAYVVFTVGVFLMVRAGRDGRAGSWAFIGLAGGIAGPALAAAGQAAHASLLVRATDGLPADSATAFLYDMHLEVQTVAAVFIALFLAGMTTAGWRSGTLPRPFVWSGWGLASYVIVVSPAAYTSNSTWQYAVLIGFALAALWEFALGGWMLMTADNGVTNDPPAVFARRAIFGVVAVAAGVSGLALLAFPGSTPRFFSWGLTPPPLAALIGGFYVASATTFALAVRRDWDETRGLMIGVVALSVPIFMVTLLHTEVFDFGVPQAWAWVVLFAVFPVAALAVIALHARSSDSDLEIRSLGPDSEHRTIVPGWVRGVLAVMAGALLAAALGFWLDPIGMTRYVPFTVPPLGGRVLGGWMAFLSVLAGWSALRARPREIRLPVLAIALCCVAVAVALVRTASDLT